MIISHKWGLIYFHLYDIQSSLSHKWVYHLKKKLIKRIFINSILYSVNNSIKLSKVFFPFYIHVFFIQLFFTQLYFTHSIQKLFQWLYILLDIIQFYSYSFITFLYNTIFIHIETTTYSLYGIVLHREIIHSILLYKKNCNRINRINRVNILF